MKKVISQKVEKKFRQGRKVVPPRITFRYEELKDNEVIVQRMYNRIFEIAKQNILARRRQGSIL